MTAILDAAGEIIDFDQHGREVSWEYRDEDLGDCAGCGEMIYGHVKRARTKGKQEGGWIADKPAMWRAQPFRDGIWLEPWHLDCADRYLIDWTIARDRKIHRSTCVHARTDGHHFHGRRREAEWAQEQLGFRFRGFCDLCAPIDFFWYERFIGGFVAAPSVPGPDAGQAPLPPALLDPTKAPAQ